MECPLCFIQTPNQIGMVCCTCGYCGRKKCSACECDCLKEKDKYSYMVNYDRDKNYIQEEGEGMFSNFGEAWDYAHEEFVNEERRTGRITISLFIDNNNLTEIWKRPSLRKK